MLGLWGSVGALWGFRVQGSIPRALRHTACAPVDVSATILPALEAEEQWVENSETPPELAMYWWQASESGTQAPSLAAPAAAVQLTALAGAPPCIFRVYCPGMVTLTSDPRVTASGNCRRIHAGTLGT